VNIWPFVSAAWLLDIDTVNGRIRAEEFSPHS
jgi:hypothetical protein